MIDRRRLPEVKAYFAPQAFDTNEGPMILCATMRLVRAYNMVRHRADEGARAALQKHYEGYAIVRDIAYKELRGIKPPWCSCEWCLQHTGGKLRGSLHDGYSQWVERLVEHRLLLWDTESAQQVERRVKRSVAAENNHWSLMP